MANVDPSTATIAGGTSAAIALLMAWALHQKRKKKKSADRQIQTSQTRSAAMPNNEPFMNAAAADETAVNEEVIPAVTYPNNQEDVARLIERLPDGPAKQFLHENPSLHNDIRAFELNEERNAIVRLTADGTHKFASPLKSEKLGTIVGTQAGINIYDTHSRCETPYQVEVHWNGNEWEQTESVIEAEEVPAVPGLRQEIADVTFGSPLTRNQNFPPLRDDSGDSSESYTAEEKAEASSLFINSLKPNWPARKFLEDNPRLIDFIEVLTVDIDRKYIDKISIRGAHQFESILSRKGAEMIGCKDGRWIASVKDGKGRGIDPDGNAVIWNGEDWVDEQQIPEQSADQAAETNEIQEQYVNELVTVATNPANYKDEMITADAAIKLQKLLQDDRLPTLDVIQNTEIPDRFKRTLIRAQVIKELKNLNEFEMNEKGLVTDLHEVDPSPEFLRRLDIVLASGDAKELLKQTPEAYSCIAQIHITKGYPKQVVWKGTQVFRNSRFAAGVKDGVTLDRIEMYGTVIPGFGKIDDDYYIWKENGWQRSDFKKIASVFMKLQGVSLRDTDGSVPGGEITIIAFDRLKMLKQNRETQQRIIVEIIRQLPSGQAKTTLQSLNADNILSFVVDPTTNTLKSIRVLEDQNKEDA